MKPGAEQIRLGALADTHMPHRLPQLPPAVIEAFAGARVDLILHAGDVDDPRCLEPLTRVAPVIAVRGNVHPQDFSRGGVELPLHVELMVSGRRLILTHGHQRGVIAFGSKVIVVLALRLGFIDRERINRRIAHRLHRRFPRADVVVFGHSHQSFQGRLGETFFFNPGAVLRDSHLTPSVGLLTLCDQKVTAEIVPLPLERENHVE